MRDAEGVPEDDVGVNEVGGGVGFDPGGDALGGGAGGLRDVAARGVELCVVVWGVLVDGTLFVWCVGRLTLCDVHSVSCEAGSLPHQTAWLWQQFWYLPADQLIRNGFLAVRIQFALVAHLPCSARATVVVCGSQLRGTELCLLRIERIAVLVLFAADLAVSTCSVHHEDGIVRTVDIRVYPHAEQVLVVMCVDSGVDFCSPALEVLTGKHGVRV